MYVGTHEKGWRQEFSFYCAYSKLLLVTVITASLKQQLGDKHLGSYHHSNYSRPYIEEG